MAYSYFTPEEIEQLRANPCTYSVTPTRIAFTEEFQNKFWEEYSHGNSPTGIFAAFGYDVKVVGPRRIEHFTKKMKNSFGSNTDYYNGLRSSNTAASTGDCVIDNRLNDMDNQLRNLTHMVAILQQELDFVKKKYSAITSRKP